MKLKEAFAKRTYRADHNEWLDQYGREIGKEIYKFTNHEFAEDQYKPWENYQTARTLARDMEKHISNELERLYYADEMAQGPGRPEDRR